jgi:hypothetical protein
MNKRWTLWFGVLLGFLLSWLTGFSIGRFIVIGPLLLTAYVMSRGRGTAFLIASALVALGLWILFSFVLFGVVLLETGFAIETALCLVLLILSAILRPIPKSP